MTTSRDQQLKLVVDDDIECAREIFDPFGELTLLEGRYLQAAQVSDADILLVRSVTPVTAQLLGDAPVQFVGTATAGFDHIDLDMLAQRNIRFSAAPGCNARAVAEHVIAIVLDAMTKPANTTNRFEPQTIGIVGYGHVGQATAALAQAFGLQTLICDPPRGRQHDDVDYVDLKTVLGADVVTLHVPLTKTGSDHTFHLIAARELAALNGSQLLINAARGGVIDESALHQRLEQPNPPRVALDCWANEPDIDHTLLARVDWASPHIAGHTIDARFKASCQLADALSEFLQRERAGVCAPATSTANVIEPGTQAPLASFQAVISACVDVDLRTRRTREIASLPDAERGRAFDALRREFGTRREFHCHSIASAGMDADTAGRLRQMGFNQEA